MPYVPQYVPQSPPLGKTLAVSTDNPDPIEFGRIVVEEVFLDEWGREVVETRRDKRLSYYGENHMIIIGKQGMGKDTRLLIPNLLRMRGRSIVAIDPKGEMAAVTAPVRAKYGRVVILNPFGVLCDYQGYGHYMQGCGFNPLCAFDPSSPNFNKDAGLLAEALIKVTSDEKQPFFPIMARALVSFLIMYECVKAKQQGRDPYLFNVRRMICEASQEATPAMTIGGVRMQGQPAKGIPAYAREMADCAITGLRNKAGQFVKWTKGIQDAAATAQSETEFLDDPQIAYCLARNDFDFREVKKHPTTVYLVLPMDVMERHAKWLRMMLTAALNACMRPRAKNEPRTLFIFNEFAAIGHLSLVETNFTVVRGAGIQMALVLQDLNQLKQLYKERWQTFIGNSDVTATFAPNDLETAEWFSKRCAETERLKITVSESAGQNSGNTVNQGLAGNGETSGAGVSGGSNYGWSAQHSYERVPLVTPLDLYSMTAGEMRIVWAEGGNAGETYHAHARPYYEMKNLIAETRPPDNPYRRNANLPRVHWQQPDYEAFMLNILNTSQPAPEIGSGDSWDNDGGASSGNIFDQMFGKGRSSSSSDAWDTPGSGGGWGDDRATSSESIFDQMFGKGLYSSSGNAWSTQGSGGGWDAPQNDGRPENLFDGLFRGKSQRNTNPDGGLPPNWREILRAKGKMQPEWDEPQPWETPAPPEKPPQHPTQENIKPNVQARHPGYTPDPPKDGGDDWVE